MPTKAAKRGEKLTHAAARAHADAPTTPDRRYIIVDGVLWRAANPNLAPDEKEDLVRALMDARRAVGAALKSGDEGAERRARRQVHKTKIALGERGAVWWSDGAPDYNRRRVENSPYAAWFALRK